MNDAYVGPREPAHGNLRLADREIDFANGVLRDGRGEAVELRPQVWAVLQHLARHPNRVVTRDELLAAIWPVWSSRTVQSLRRSVTSARRWAMRGIRSSRPWRGAATC